MNNFPVENEETMICELFEFCDDDAATYRGRMNMVKICRSLTVEALDKKCDKLLQLISQRECSCADIARNVTVSEYAKKAIESIQALLLKAGELEKCIGAREEEMKVRNVIEIMKSFGKSCEAKCMELRQGKLHDIFEFTSRPSCVTVTEDMIMESVTEPDNNASLPITNEASDSESGVDEMFEQFLESKISKWQKLLLGTGLMTWVTMWVVPSKYRLMMIIFLLCTFMTFRPCVYRVPSVI